MKRQLQQLEATFLIFAGKKKRKKKENGAFFFPANQHLRDEMKILSNSVQPAFLLRHFFVNQAGDYEDGDDDVDEEDEDEDP